MGFTFATHYCGGRAVKSKMMLGNNDLGCGFVQVFCKKQGTETAVKKKNCCSNEYLSMGVEGELNSVKTKVSINPIFVATFVYTFIKVFSLDINESRFLDYSIPIVLKGITILFQNFRI